MRIKRQHRYHNEKLVFEQPDGGQGGLGGGKDGGVTVVVGGDTAMEIRRAFGLDGRDGVLCIVRNRSYVDFMRSDRDGSTAGFPA